MLFSPEKKIDKLIIAENDLYRRADDEAIEKLLDRSAQVIVIDQLINRTVQKSDILLPAATFAESEGTLVNNEGRAQRYYKALNNKDEVKESWRWIVDLMNGGIGNKSVSWDRVDDVLESIAGELKVFLKMRNYEPGADFRMLNTKIPRQTFRYSGRTAMTANIMVSEPEPIQDRDSPLAYSMEGQPEDPPSSLVPFYWTPGWNSVQALYKEYTEEPDTSLRGGDPGIRLFESDGSSGRISFNPVAHDRELRKDEYEIVPFYQIFGSEELSSSSPAVIHKIKEPFLLINQKDAGNLLFADGDQVQVEISEIKISVRIKTGTDIQPGMAALSVNLPGMPFIALPAKGKFHKL
jgi:NADH-quinone oxidoreductase subunit G